MSSLVFHRNRRGLLSPGAWRRLLVVVCLAGAPAVASAQAGSGGTIAGRVTLAVNGDPVHNANILVVGINRVTRTDDEGRFEIRDVPPGTYEVLAVREHLNTQPRTVTVAAEQRAEVDFELALSPFHEEVTVTASPVGQVTTFDAFNSVTSLDALELARNMQPTVAEVLESEPGVAKRSFGPGNSRPIIRGFDGDRVLIMEDGIRTGDLSSQSGDHGVTLDPASLERLEIVKGPATLLYGSNAIGGVVNAVTPHESMKGAPPTGTRGQVTADFGSANEQAGLNASVQHGQGRWLFWGGGGGRRTDDYSTPLGNVENSGSRLTNGRAGLGYLGDRAFVSFGYQAEDGRFGVPFAGEFHAHGDEGEEAPVEGEEDHAEEELFVDLSTRRQSTRADFGFRDLPNRALDSVRVTVNFLDYTHDELEIDEGIEEVGTRFDNETFIVRAEVDQRRIGRLSGKFGATGEFRDFSATGEEALAPATTQRSFAVFAYEEMDFGGYRLQFGGRLDRNSFDPEARVPLVHDDEDGEEEGEAELEPPEAIARAFTGFSGSAGVHVDIGPDSAFVANVTRSYRAPALEELYNFGPHVGNLAFEVGNPDLEREATTGVDFSVRHRGSRVRGEFNVYYYAIDNFVFPAFTDEILDSLRVADFLQGDSRFAGIDAKGNFQVHEHLWLNVGIGSVDARLTDGDEPLPRIPPVHGRVELQAPFGPLTVSPELVWSADQDDVFRSETSTGGYAIVNLNASYVLGRRHAAHIFSLTAYNLTDRLYREHTSFIKDLAPQIGRGVRVAYSVRFF